MIVPVCSQIKPALNILSFSPLKKKTHIHFINKNDCNIHMKQVTIFWSFFFSFFFQFGSFHTVSHSTINQP